MALSCGYSQEESRSLRRLDGNFSAMVGSPDFGFFMNLKRTIFKLQTALCCKGRKVKINQMQSWSEKHERMVTKFVIIENGETVLSTYQTAEVVKVLADMLGGG